MSANNPTQEDPTAVVHCFRSPVGGVFRHVCDLATGQGRLGLKVGVICDAKTGGHPAEMALEEMKPYCKLGIHRVPMRRSLHWSDLGTHRTLSNICRQLGPSIIHGHGAKGGAFARLLRNRVAAKVIYTPHGGVLHYDKSSLAGRYYFALERYLQRATDGVVFASHFGAQQYEKKIGAISVPHQVIHNGLRTEDFVNIPHASQEHEFVFVGELRMLKGLDTVLQAIAQLRRPGKARLLAYGAGPDASFFASRVRELGIESEVTMLPPIFPVTKAFAKARCLVVPSHAESFPYIVLEAAAAGMPLITTNAGGIPEIFGPYSNRLIPPGDVAALATAMVSELDHPEKAVQFASSLADRVRDQFKVKTMVDASLSFYRRVLDQG